MIGIIAGSVTALVVIVVSIIIIIYCKKHKKGCFRPKRQRAERY